MCGCPFPLRVYKLPCRHSNNAPTSTDSIPPYRLQLTWKHHGCVPECHWDRQLLVQCRDDQSTGWRLRSGRRSRLQPRLQSGLPQVSDPVMLDDASPLLIALYAQPFLQYTRGSGVCSIPHDGLHAAVHCQYISSHHLQYLPDLQYLPTFQCLSPLQYVQFPRHLLPVRYIPSVQYLHLLDSGRRGLSQQLLDRHWAEHEADSQRKK